MRATHLDTVEQLLEHAQQHGSLGGCIASGLDLGPYAELLATVEVSDAVFLGCRLPRDGRVDLTQRGATLFPNLGEGRPYRPHRAGLYSLQELMAGFELSLPGSLSSSLDYRIYEHFQHYRKQALPPLLETLAQRMHDHAIDDALRELLHGTEKRKVVGVMGGHALRRDESGYAEVAKLGWLLSRAGYFVVTGGGPGAMEAANLGAWLATSDELALRRAVKQLSGAPDYRTHEYLECGYQVRSGFAGGGESLAIPTWFYGHEPTNQFATHIAKYFSNSLREDGLLAIALHGVVYAPGSAGTISELFMDATQNHYETFGWVSPMVLLDRAAWTDHKPVLPLLEALASGRPYAAMISAVDTAAQALAYIESHPPAGAKGAS